jgi:threonyl-tRNA synthetase
MEPVASSEKEKASRTVAVRTRDGDDLGSFTLDQVINLFTESAQRRGRSVVETE